MLKNVLIDIEANNLLAPLINYSSLPYKLKEEAVIWCIVLRDLDTDASYLLVDNKNIDHKFPVKAKKYYKDIINIYTEYFDENNLLQHTEVLNDTLYQLLTEESKVSLDVVEVAIKEAIWYNSQTKYDMTKRNLQHFLKDCDTLVGHNILNYDLPMLFLYGLLDYHVAYPGEFSKVFGRDCQLVDTLLWSKLLQPDRIDAFGKHSLAAWGQRCGFPKIDFHNFAEFTAELCFYCENDTLANARALVMIMREKGDWEGWDFPYSMEAKVIDLNVKQEHFGMHFDSELAHKCVTELDGLLTDRENIIIPKLPPKPMNKGEIAGYTPPAKQLLKNGEPNSFIKKFAEKVRGEITVIPSVADPDSVDYYFKYNGRQFKIPFDQPVETEIQAQMKDTDHIKGYLLSLGWNPTEWSVRDVVRDTKKKMMEKEKVIETIERYVTQTLSGPYKEYRLRELETTEGKLRSFLLSSYEKSPKRPLKVPTSPKIKVGTDKEICPNLLKIKNNIEFSTAFAEYSTYKHRKTSISGGDIDEETGEPSKGFLSFVREDGRVPTPADTLGASTSRMLHKQVANIPRNSSTYGENMRALFGCGKDFAQIGFDFASLEARVQGHYIMKYLGGPELAEILLQEKPNDIHTLNAIKLGISRDDAKSITYALLYGAAAEKLQKMLGLSKKDAEAMYEAYWDAVPPLRELRDNLVKYWKSTDEKYIVAIDGRKLNSRSEHSLVNLLFQGTGAIMAKWSVVRIAQLLEAKGLLGNPFVHSKDDVKAWQMIVYHDEVQYALHRSLVKTKVFGTPELYKEFKEYGKEYKTFSEEKQKELGKPKNPCDELAKTFIEENKDLGQFSDIGHLDDGRSYITFPGLFSEILLEGVAIAEKENNLKINLGISWISGANWKMCH